MIIFFVQILMYNNILNITWGSYMWFFWVHLWYLYFFEFCTEWLKHKWCDTRELKMQTSLCISKMAKWYKLNWVDFLIWYIAIELSQFEIASVVSFYQGKLYFPGQFFCLNLKTNVLKLLVRFQVYVFYFCVPLII